MAMWLYNLGKQTNSPLDINVKNDYIFAQICYGGDIEMATWLFDLGLKNRNTNKYTK